MDDLFKNKAGKILELFIEFPGKDFSVRGIARSLRLSHATVLNYVDGLARLGLIKKKKETLYPTFYANTESQKYRFYKRNYLVFRLIDSGAIDFIQKQVFPSCIVLFGSGAKAVFTEKSDIDIFVEAQASKLDLRKFEKMFGRKINLLFERDINGLSKELRNNIINGVVLYGFIKVNGDEKYG